MAIIVFSRSPDIGFNSFWFLKAFVVCKRILTASVYEHGFLNFWMYNCKLCANRLSTWWCNMEVPRAQCPARRFISNQRRRFGSTQYQLVIKDEPSDPFQVVLVLLFICWILHFDHQLPSQNLTSTGNTTVIAVFTFVQCILAVAKVLSKSSACAFSLKASGFRFNDHCPIN